jgi:glutathione S-transferase
LSTQDPVLYHFPRSLSSAAVQVVRELGAPVTVRVLEFSDGQFSSRDEPRMKLPTGGMGLIGPVRSCPTYREGAAGSEITLVQCAPIIERLCDRFDPGDRFRPPAGSSERARHLSLMVFAEATFFPVIQFLAAEGSPNDTPREEIRRQRFRGLVAPFLIDALRSNPYMCGAELSACDFLMGIPCLNNAFHAGVLAPFPQLSAYFDRLRERDSFAEAHGNSEDPTYNASLVEMVSTAHGDRWDFEFRTPHEAASGINLASG